MTEQLLNGMDENYETTKNESRHSSIGFLQSQVANMYPSITMYEDSFFWEDVYFAGEKVNVSLLEAGKVEVEQIRQVQIMKEKTNALQ